MTKKIWAKPQLMISDYSTEQLGGYGDESLMLLREGLQATKKFIPVEVTYDDKGSLYFDKFIETKEYYIPAKEIEILNTYKHQIAELTGYCNIYDVGAGSSKKTVILLQEYSRRYGKVNFHPIDINQNIMLEGAKSYINEIEGINVHCIVGAYCDVFNRKITNSERNLFILIGSSISQEADDRLLSDIRKQLNVGDYFLISFDLQKEPDILRSAYQNDAAALCSLNVLDHLNETFGANFDREKFSFDVLFNPAHGGCETHLRSNCEQNIHLSALDMTIHFDKGELIRTATQRKFQADQMSKRIERVGFRESKRFTDAQSWYMAMLLEAI